MKITPYLWMVSLDGDISVGPIDQDIDMSFSDILKELDISALDLNMYGFMIGYKFN